MLLGMLNNRAALRWAAGITYSLVVVTITSFYHWQFYALMALMYIIDRETFRQGVEEGVCIGVSMNTKDRRRLKKILDDETKEQDKE